MTELLWPFNLHHSIPSNSRGELGSSLDADGSFHFWTPGVLRGRPEIGYYVHKFPPQRALDFRALVEQAKVWDLPRLKALAPEQPHVFMMAGDWEGGPKRSVMWAIDALPAEVLPIMEAFHKMVDEAFASPREVLAGTARWTAPSFSAREPLRLEFTLSNKGTQQISLQDPMAPEEGESLLSLLISQVPSREVPAPTPKHVTITPHMLSRPDQAQPHARRAPGSRLELAPGESVRFVATPSAYLSPAEHRAVLLLDTGESPQPPTDHVHGILAVDTPLLRIAHR
ncbi:hypothetical protein SAMN02745121_03060 [Nannocystis exedens]|uniref:Uncharacterized protein n=1 Tax=Nannocystis exedens TaxID=54 RepID=A0A1I1XT53_9BACT|nr:hypothetical protein [Nannocystis exedens]PCC73213.1 hypothetical protein NAEX_06301 [Nannocystis exedens]SFE10557.1 hypothetical protein SAMN02745121_03060 [Nannocystis exedens]